jgi:pimeloyl-ACP methyl ester carboxylesterase
MQELPPYRAVEVTGDGGVRLRARSIAGPDRAAPGLLLHHGLASSQHIWDLMLSRLVRRFRVVTYDARGHGESAKPGSGYGFGPVAGDAVAVARATRLRRPTLVGHSWGAMVALDAAVRHPRSFHRIVLIDGGVTRMRDGFPSWDAAKRALSPPNIAGMTVEDFRRAIPMFWGGVVPVTPEIEAIPLSVVRVGSAGTIRPRLRRANHLRILHAIWGQDPVALHARLRVPALAILARPAGADDAWTREKERAVRQLRAAGSGPRVRWIEGIHDLPIQHPGRLVDLIARSGAGSVR